MADQNVINKFGFIIINQLYFLMNSRYSLKEILLLPSLSIWSKFQFTISSVIVMLSGLKVSYISFLNSSRSISSSSLSVPLLSFMHFFARSPKKWWNFIKNVLHILGMLFFHHHSHQFSRNANLTDLVKLLQVTFPNYQQEELLILLFLG